MPEFKITSRYRIVCEYTWGGIPLDIKWAMETSIYKEMEKSLLSRGIIKDL